MFHTTNNKTPDKILISESTFVYFPESFKDLDFKLMDVEVENQKDFDILVCYSYDKRNFSRFQTIEHVRQSNPDMLGLPLHVCIWFKRKVHKDLEVPTSLHEGTFSNYITNGREMRNVTRHSSDPFQLTQHSSLVLKSIRYNGKEFCLEQLKFRTTFDLIDEFPRWNFYDNQYVNIKRWLEQCNAISELYGHTVVYFKTEPIETEMNQQSGIKGIHYTLMNNVIRNVVDIKKLHVVLPSNEIPQDRVIFSDWDIAMQDDFMIHVVRQKFEQAFGLNAVPNEKDIIYIPMINKLFRVSTMHPKNGFMGVIGWYEVFLQKWEDDEHVVSEVKIDSTLKNSLVSEFGFQTGFEVFQDFDVEKLPIMSEYEEIGKQTDDYVVEEKRIEEEKEATDNFSNRLVDSTWLVSLKETEKLREFYDRRLQITSVNPSDNAFPITMYDMGAIEKRSVALTYSLQDYSVNNKFQTLMKTNYQLMFNLVFMGRFNGELFDIIDSSSNIISSISISNQKIKVFDSFRQVEVVFEHKFDQRELYQIIIEYQIKPLECYCFKIFKLNENKERILVDQNIFELKKYSTITDNTKQKNPKQKNPKQIRSINMYGGTYLINDITFFIDNQKFIEDNCHPLLNYNQL